MGLGVGVFLGALNPIFSVSERRANDDQGQAHPGGRGSGAHTQPLLPLIFLTRCFSIWLRISVPAHVYAVPTYNVLLIKLVMLAGAREPP